MAGYQPLKIAGNTTGLVQEREEFLLPNDAYPILQNAYVWRERILKKDGAKFLGRLRREIPEEFWFKVSPSVWSFTIKTQMGYIIDITAGGTVTTKYAHGLTTGDQVVFSGITGAVGYNDNTYVVTVLTPTTFTVPAAFPGYTLAVAPDSYVTTSHFNGTYISNRSSTETLSSLEPGSITFTLKGAPDIVFTDTFGDSVLYTSTTQTDNIFGITLGNPTVIDCINTFAPGDSVLINGIEGTTELNNQIFTVTAASGVDFEIAVDSTDFEPYIDDGFVYSVNVGLVNYNTMELFLIHDDTNIGNDATLAFSYYPGLPVMGILSRELDSTSLEETIFFDTTYAYQINTGNIFSEFIPGTQWTGTDYQFFWDTNYWQTSTPSKIFWVTNFSGVNGDPIRYTDGTVWIDFAPTINAGGDKLNQCLALLPFRGRLVAFNTLEGPALASSKQFFQRIRWAEIGNPISDASVLFPAGTIVADAWRDDIRGKGGFLDIPTSQAITAVGFVRDNLVIYCERSTWQLRYTGRSIAPFQIEKVNSELGTGSAFSAIQFDTSLAGIGDKGIVQCDSYKSERFDIKIPDLAFEIDNVNNNDKRVYGIRDFQKKLAYWMYVDDDDGVNFPNTRLVYNYENDSWATFLDAFTALGTYQPITAETWAEANYTWASANFPPSKFPALFPFIAGGNQQGFIFILDNLEINGKSLHIFNITTTNTEGGFVEIEIFNAVLTSQFVRISGILGFDGYASLNNTGETVYRIAQRSANSYVIYSYNPDTDQFDQIVFVPTGVYLGEGYITFVDNFYVQSKKFNFMDEGQNIQLGYIDILMDNTDEGAISVYIFNDYNDSSPVNTYPQNADANDIPDTFFNTAIPTTVPINRGSTKNWQRVYCSSRAGFITVVYTLSNGQMNTICNQSDVQIDAQILWIRKAGKGLAVGI